MSRIWLIAASLLGFVIVASPASADAVLSLNDVGGMTAYGYTAGGNTFGTVNLHQCTGTEVTNPCAIGTVQVTVALNVIPAPSPAPPGGNVYDFANTGAADYAVSWNLIGDPSSTITVVSPSTKFTAGPGTSGQYLKASPYTASGHCGDATKEIRADCFEYGVALNSTGTSGNVQGPLIFDVTKSGGLLISDFAAAVGGVYFAVDMGINGNTAVVGASTGGGNTQSLPEPATLLLFGAGAAGAAALRRRRNCITA